MQNSIEARSKAERINVERIARRTFQVILNALSALPDDSALVIQLDHVEEELRRRLDRKNYIRCFSCDGEGERRVKNSHLIIDCHDCRRYGLHATDACAALTKTTPRRPARELKGANTWHRSKQNGRSEKPNSAPALRPPKIERRTPRQFQHSEKRRAKSQACKRRDARSFVWPDASA